MSFEKKIAECYHKDITCKESPMQSEMKNILLRKVPIEIYQRLDRAAKEHHRSLNQEAIVALSNGLEMPLKSIQKPIPFKWKKKITGRFIQKAIEEGRE